MPMDSTIGAARTIHNDPSLENFRKTVLDFRLDGWGLRLALPAVKVRPSVFDVQPNIHGAYY